MKTAVVAGATGLIGSQLLALLLKDQRYGKVIALSRKPMALTDPKLVNVVSDPHTLEELADLIQGDDIFCCLGTTMRKARTREAFRNIDYDYPLTLARLTHQRGARQYLLVSALGANAHSSIFYNRVKGEVEVAIAAVGFETLHIFQPSLLLGERAEERAGENAAKWVYRKLGFLIPKNYKAIGGDQVARAMIAFAMSGQQGKFVHTSGELQKY